MNDDPWMAVSGIALTSFYALSLLIYCCLRNRQIYINICSPLHRDILQVTSSPMQSLTGAISYVLESKEASLLLQKFSVLRRQPGILEGNYHSRVDSSANGMTNCAAVVAVVMSSSVLGVNILSKQAIFNL